MARSMAASTRRLNAFGRGAERGAVVMADSATIYTDGRYLEHNPHWHEKDAAWKARNIERNLGIE